MSVEVKPFSLWIHRRKRTVYRVLGLVNMGADAAHTGEFPVTVVYLESNSVVLWVVRLMMLLFRGSGLWALPMDKFLAKFEPYVGTD